MRASFRGCLNLLLGLSLVVGPGASVVSAQEPAAERPPEAPPPPRVGEDRDASSGPRPFGANLFTGSYAAQREDGINPDYEILPGDRVLVNAWGAVELNDVFAVDTQGNIFLPGIGPVRLSGVRNEDLTATVRRTIERVYRGQFGVYTNLLTASPVAVFVTGGVRRPGRYAGIPSDSVLFFLDQAGGIDAERGSFRHVRILRQGQSLADVDLYDFILNGQLPSPQLADGDVILVGQRGPVVEVRRQGEGIMVELRDESLTGERLLEVTPIGPRTDGVTLRGNRDGLSIVRSLDVPTFTRTELRDGDVVTLRQDQHPDTIVVHLEGEYRGPAELAVRRGARLLDLLNYVHVDPDLAHVGAVFVRRPEIARQQRQALQESLDRLERSTMLAVAGSTGESEIRVREAEMVQGFVQRARTIEPLGRMVTTSAGRELNVLLRDGDTVVIPSRTNVIRVVGEVQIAHAVMYRPDLRVRDYVQMAGGYSTRADRGTVIVMRANAEVAVGGMDTPIYPGDELMVPPQVDDKFLQNGIDLIQAIYQIAIAASVVLRPL